MLFGSMPMVLYASVFKAPKGCANSSFAGKAVQKTKRIIGKIFIKVQGAKTVIKTVVLVVPGT